MSRYNSLDEIKNDFSIHTDDLEILKNHLRHVRNTNHPDKTNGEFADTKTSDLFHKVSDALDYIDRFENNHSLVVVEKMTELMKVFTELIPTNRQTSLEQNLENKMNNALSTFRSRYFIPKITVTAITAVMTFLFFIPSTINESPIISKFINTESPLFIAGWFVALTYCGVFWMLAFWNEEKEKRRLARLKVDSVQNDLFEEFIKNLDEDQFSKDALTRFIHTRSRNKSKTTTVAATAALLTANLGSEIVSPDIAQNIAEIVLARAEKNKVIQKLPITSLSDMYSIRRQST